MISVGVKMKRKLDDDRMKEVLRLLTSIEDDGDESPVASSSKVEPPKKKVKREEKPQFESLWDVAIHGEASGEIPVYDDCNEVRRKIRALQKEPGFKVTHWLKDIGNVSSNSLGQFMTQKGANGGAGNIIYYKGYIYFENKRVFEGKKKTAKRLQNEIDHPYGFSLQTRKGFWAPKGRR